MRTLTLPPSRQAAIDSKPRDSALPPLAIPKKAGARNLWLDRCESFAVALLALLVIALHVRFATNVGGLWRDEANSINLATLPSFAEMWRLLDYDSFPMLFFAVLRGWTAVFGADDDLALRALGLITGLGIFGALWANARSFGVRWPVLSFALLGLNPMLIRYGDSTRAYGLGIFLILLTFRSFWRLVDSSAPPTWKRISIATLLALLSVQCLYYNSVLLLAIAAGATAVAIRARAWRTVGIVLGIGMVAAASLVPYLPMMRRMQEWKFLVTYPADFAWLWKRILEVLVSPSRIGAWLWPALVIDGLLVVLVLWANGLRKRRTAMNSIPPAVLFAAVTLTVGIAGYAGFLRVLNYFTQPWYYITLVAFVACGLEVIFAAWPAANKVSIALRFARLAVALLLLCVAALPAWKNLTTRHTNVDLIAARLQPLMTADDLVIVPLWENAIPFCRYYRGPAQVITIPPIVDHRFHRYDLLVGQMMTHDPLRPVFARMEEVLRSGHRIFLVGALPLPKLDRPPPVPPAAFKDSQGHWHGDAYGRSWQIQTGYFLRVNSTNGVKIEVPIPDNSPVQEYENLQVAVVQGWRETVEGK